MRLRQSSAAAEKKITRAAWRISTLTDADGWAVCGGSVRDQRWGSMGWNLSQGCLLCSCRIQGCRFGCKWYCDWCQHNVQRSNGLGIIYQGLKYCSNIFVWIRVCLTSSILAGGKFGKMARSDKIHTPRSSFWTCAFELTDYVVVDADILSFSFLKLRCIFLHFHPVATRINCNHKKS